MTALAYVNSVVICLAAYNGPDVHAPCESLASQSIHNYLWSHDDEVAMSPWYISLGIEESVVLVLIWHFWREYEGTRRLPKTVHTLSSCQWTFEFSYRTHCATKLVHIFQKLQYTRPRKASITHESPSVIMFPAHNYPMEQLLLPSVQNCQSLFFYIMSHTLYLT